MAQHQNVFFLCAVEIRSITRVTAKDICSIYGAEGDIRGGNVLNQAVPHHLLMHAIILFPAFVRRLLEKLQIKGEQRVPGETNIFGNRHLFRAASPRLWLTVAVWRTCVACRRFPLSGYPMGYALVRTAAVVARVSYPPEVSGQTAGLLPGFAALLRSNLCSRGIGICRRSFCGSGRPVCTTPW